MGNNKYLPGIHVILASFILTACQTQVPTFPPPASNLVTSPAITQPVLKPLTQLMAPGLAATSPDFSVQATQTPTLTLMMAGQKVTLSATFMSRFKTLVADGVLNKDEFATLSQGATASEGVFLNILKGYGAVTIPNLVTAPTDPATLSFACYPNQNLTGRFLQAMYTLVRDGVLSLADINVLNQTANADEKAYLTYVSQYDSFGNMPVLDASAKLVQMNVNLYYNESDLVPGTTSTDLVSMLSQGDRLSATTTDAYRCMASAILNVVLLTEGKAGFTRLAKALGTPSDLFNYQNIHLLQDALYRKAGGGTGGLSTSYNPVTGAIAGGTAITALGLAGLKWLPNLLSKTSGSYKTATELFFRNNPTGALLASVRLQNNSINFDGAANHGVVITYNAGSYYMSDTGASRNGAGIAYRALTATEVTALFASTYTSPVIQVKPASAP